MDAVQLVGVILVFAIWSYVIYKENIAYSFAEKTFIGVTVGHSVMLGLTAMWNQNISKVSAGNLLLIIPILLGFTYLLRLSPKYTWISRYATGIHIGTVLGMAICIAPITINSYIRATFLDLRNPNNIVIVGGAILVIFYYFFQRKPGRISDILSKVGRAYIMINIGSSAAGTLLTRQAYLTERVSFLLKAFGII